MNKPNFTHVELLDAEVQNVRHPKSFRLPSLKKRQTVPVGAYAKLVFQGDPTCHIAFHCWTPLGERLWVYVEARAPNGNYVGEVVSEVLVLKTIRSGDKVLFEPRHIIEIDLEPAPPMEAA